MNFEFQSKAENELKNLIQSDKHSILLLGGQGCGKTYLATNCAKYIGTDNVVCVESNVTDLRDAIDTSYSVSDVVLIIIENLDESTNRSSYTLLKFLEEPRSNIYIIVTCRNIKNIPDTIVSRSEVVNIGHPTEQDIIKYGRNIDLVKYELMSKRSIWNIVRSFYDVDTLYNLDTAKLDYFDELSHGLNFKDTISNMLWSFMHYKDNSEIDLVLVIRYILYSCNSLHVKQFCIEALKDIQQSRISQFAIMSKFLFECKYGGGSTR